MSSPQRALDDLIVELREQPSDDGGCALTGAMRFAKALEGPPGRLHGGYHAHVRTLPIVSRCSAHDPARTFPCALDVDIRQALPLEQDVPFDATYHSTEAGWELRTRFDGSERLRATLRSLPSGPLLTEDELARYRSLHAASHPPDSTFKMFGVSVQLGAQLVMVAGQDPRRTQPGSQLADLTDDDGSFGPALIAAQLDAVGAVAQGTRMRHPHFTKRIELSYAQASVPKETAFVFVSDRTTIEVDTHSTTPSVEIKGQRWGTVRVRVALLDARFEHAFAVGHVTVHPVDPEKFAPLKEMRQLRDDSGA